MKFSNLKKQAQDFLGQYKTENQATYAAAQQAIGGLLILDGFTGIDNPFGGKDRPGIFGSLIGIVVGFVFVFMPVIFNSFSGTDKMTAATSATVVSVKQDSTASSDSGSTCTAVAKYSVGGTEYSQVSSFGSSYYCSLTPGSTININYNPNNPGAWGYNIKSISNFMKIFSVVGVIVVISSLVTFAIRLLSIVFGWKLLKSGRALAKTLPEGTNIDTVVNEIKQNFAKSVFNFGGSNTPTPAPTPSQVPLNQPPQSTPPGVPQ
jgi:hypothetical protein